MFNYLNNNTSGGAYNVHLVTCCNQFIYLWTSSSFSTNAKYLEIHHKLQCCILINIFTPFQKYPLYTHPPAPISGTIFLGIQTRISVVMAVFLTKQLSDIYSGCQNIRFISVKHSKASLSLLFMYFMFSFFRFSSVLVCVMLDGSYKY